ncbi:MAG: hypothetical protein R3F19_18765 [Verrucomicrobiales bacterium]
MLTIPSNTNSSFCDGISRRNFLKIGGLGLGGLSMSQLFQAEAANKIGSSNKSVIMVYLPGGPPHQDMYDIKMDAPAEIRGEFKPDPDECPGDSNLRAHATAGKDGGQAGNHPLHGRRKGSSRVLPMHDWPT